jgi:hypothetical protein
MYRVVHLTGRTYVQHCSFPFLSLHVFFVTPGMDRMRKALSRAHDEHLIMHYETSLNIPLFLTLYTSSTTTSISLTAAELKFFLTASANCSFGTRLLSLLLAIVGLCLPIPGLVNSA